MDIDLIAMMKESHEEFLENYKEGDEKKLYDGRSLLNYAVANNNPEARFKNANFLLDKGMDASVLNPEKESLLHIAASQISNNNKTLPQTIEETAILCKRLIEAGANINQLDKNNRTALQYIISSPLTDEKLLPLYDLWFSQPELLVDVKNKWGKSPLDMAKMLSYRKIALERMLKYVKED